MSPAQGVEIRFLADGTPCLLLTGMAALSELACIVERHDRAAVYAGRVPSQAGSAFTGAARRVAALTALVPAGEPGDGETGMPAGGWITTPQAAQILKISRRAVVKRIHARTLPAQWRAGRWFIDLKEIDRAAA